MYMITCIAKCSKTIYLYYIAFKSYLLSLTFILDLFIVLFLLFLLLIPSPPPPPPLQHLSFFHPHSLQFSSPPLLSFDSSHFMIDQIKSNKNKCHSEYPNNSYSSSSSSSLVLIYPFLVPLFSHFLPSAPPLPLHSSHFMAIKLKSNQTK